MENEILKIKSDYEYVSQSENYIVFVSNTEYYGVARPLHTVK